jgi:hypothetical protein
VGAQLPAYANGNYVAAQGKGIFIILVVAHIQDPIASQAIPFGSHGIALVRNTASYYVDHLLAAEYSRAFQFPGYSEDTPPRVCFLGVLAIMYSQ